jgi:hypothetical protein
MGIVWIYMDIVRASYSQYPDIPAIPNFKFGYWKSQAQYPEKFCPRLIFLDKQRVVENLQWLEKILSMGNVRE